MSEHYAVDDDGNSLEVKEEKGYVWVRVPTGEPVNIKVYRKNERTLDV